MPEPDIINPMGIHMADEIFIGEKKCPFISIKGKEYYLLSMKDGTQFALKRMLLGKGAYGNVYEGFVYNSQTQELEGTAKAIKFYHNTKAHSIRLIEIEAQLQNYYYPTQFYQDDEAVITVMPKLPGLPLQNPKLRKRLNELPLEKKFGALVSLLQKKATFHRKRPGRKIGLSHTDSKAENFLLDIIENQETQEMEFDFYPIDFANYSRSPKTIPPEVEYGVQMMNSLEMEIYSLTEIVALILGADTETLFEQQDLVHYRFNLEKVDRYLRTEGKKQGIEKEIEEVIDMIHAMCHEDPSQRPTDFMLEKVFWQARNACLRKVKEDPFAVIDEEARDKYGRTPLYKAVLAKDIKKVKSLIKKGVKINDKDENGRTLLHLAALGKNEDVITCLLEKLLSLEPHQLECEYDFDGRSPLYCAIAVGCSFRIVQKLISGISFTEWDYIVCIQLAAATCDYKVVDYLLEKLVEESQGTRTKRELAKEYKLLHKAAIAGNTHVIEGILDNELVSINQIDSKGYTPLRIAAWCGQATACMVLMKRKARLPEDFWEIVYHSDYTLLQTAVMQGDCETVRYFLEENPLLLNKLSETGWSALHFVAEFGNVDILNVFLEKGVDPNCVGREKFSPLHCAVARKGNLAMVKALLNAKIEVNAQNEEGDTSLCIAAGLGYTEIVDALLEQGADVNLENEGGITPLYTAAKNGHVSTVSRLLACPSIDKEVKDKYGMTPLHWAASNGHTEIAALLVNEGAEVDAKGQDEMTPLHAAAECGHREVAAILLDNGAAINAVGYRAMTPLHFAIGNGHVEMAFDLLKREADLNCIDERGRKPLEVFIFSEGTPIHGCTILHAAVMQNNPEAAQWFLNCDKTLLNKLNRNGMTPLDVAIQCDNVAMVSFLLARGADPNGGHEQKSKPLQWAMRHKVDFAIVKILLTRGANVNERYKGKTSLHVAAESGDLDRVVFLLNQGADPNSQDEKGRTPLHWAVRGRNESNLAITEALLKGGAKINQRDNEGMTALHFSIESGNAKVVSTLLENGANRDAKTKEGFTPLISIAERGNAEMLDLLLPKDGDIDKKYKNGMTLLHFAAESGNANMVRNLLRKGASISARDNQERMPLYYAEKYENTKAIAILQEAKLARAQAAASQESFFSYLGRQFCSFFPSMSFLDKNEMPKNISSFIQGLYK